jgi:hypothetical protein
MLEKLEVYDAVAVVAVAVLVVVHVCVFAFQ